MEHNKLNYVIARLTLVFVWFYHGVVPKLLGPDADELAMNLAAGFNDDQALKVAYIGGAMEVLFGFFLLALWRHRWPLIASAASMVLLLVFVFIYHPALTTAAFNPVTTNLCVFVLSILAYRLSNIR